MSGGVMEHNMSRSRRGEDEAKLLHEVNMLTISMKIFVLNFNSFTEKCSQDWKMKLLKAERDKILQDVEM